VESQEVVKWEWDPGNRYQEPGRRNQVEVVVSEKLQHPPNPPQAGGNKIFVS